MLRRLLLSTALVLATIVAADAAPITARVRTACGTETYALGTDREIIQTATGRICINSDVTIASGGVASGAYASGAFASGAFAAGSIADGANVTLGAKADAKSTATDTTAISIVSILKEISAMEQAPASRAVTNAGTFAVQAAVTAAANSIADGANVALGSKADAKNTATDTTPITIMSVLKEISAMVQAPASTPVTNAGTFAVQAALAPATSGGLSWYNVEPGASDNHVVIKAGAGQVYHVSGITTHTAVQYVRLYNATTGFNGCGSATNLVYSFIIPASATGNGYVEDISQGIAFATGISICITGGYGQTDTTAATASKTEVNVGYK